MGASSPNTGDTSHSTACAPRLSTCLVASHCLHSIGLPLVLPHVRVNELDNVGSNGSSEYSRKSGLGTALAITVEHRHQRTWRRLQTRDRSQLTHFLKISDKTSYAVHLTILSHWRTLVLRGLTRIQHHYRPPPIYSPREGLEKGMTYCACSVLKKMGILANAPQGFSSAVSAINSLPQGILAEMVRSKWW